MLSVDISEDFQCIVISMNDQNNRPSKTGLEDYFYVWMYDIYYYCQGIN